MSKRITRFEANQPDWQITIQCRYSMPFRWLTKPVWKMKTHFNELFNVYKDERIDLKTVRLSRKLGARRRRPVDGGGEELTDVGPCGKHLKDGDVLTLAPRDGTVCENLDEMECVTFQMGDGIYW
ncbi:hypothetical protein AURANDRAFT_69332 [Aureococcus anophagefferens]|uniref:Uncharacterized protein n=1 Tax=Aureococcus anophagefferens TaxID=44056 RepID=F0YSF5_AURAN|nr:hypothetical protein AURANDRAFT_69332 [Aureococcus anophagefferens]XP_009043350.1 hypothetical protein AURANDRAFT_69335 [Aureococcus anophagefferens]EGB01951.1 hypothetical protein AURANDRAFT_69335 [Aureococcus anophagefferens]EGB01954.1 hypothetical protein AURANDRAFT_69332 [Aureococcus anophagefferens]|eukprot:XP_009043347.1 hypothetical protein AURANDRAFT_69332 [Aureococcus anophagefferens]